MSSDDLDVVQGVCQIESEILGIATTKIKYIEAECKKIGNKLVGFKFTMDNHCIIAKEDEEKVLQLQSKFDCASNFQGNSQIETIGTI